MDSLSSDYWFEIAEYDLETADVMLKGGRYIYVGYLCHQTIEKTLKGIFVQKKKEIPTYSKELLKKTGELNSWLKKI